MTTREGPFITLGELSEECAKTKPENCILKRVKLLAQEHLPDGWTDWKVIKASKDEVLGDTLDPQLLNKLRFALPTVGLARAFNPKLENLSEKRYRDFKVKLLDWEFARALIMSPPALSHRIRGSAVQTEIFNKAVDSLKPLLITRSKASEVLSGHVASKKDVRKRITKRNKSKVDALEKRMEHMFAILSDKIDALKTDRHIRLDATESDTECERPASVTSELDSMVSVTSWKAPKFEPDLDISLQSGSQDLPLDDLDLLPKVKEEETPVPEPRPQLKQESQELGTKIWNRISYEEEENSPELNMELEGHESQNLTLSETPEEILSTIAHALELQNKALEEDIKRLSRNHPEVAEKIRKVLLSENSPFMITTTNLLQFVSKSRAEFKDLGRGMMQ